MRQDVVDYFVHHCPTEMTQLEQWGCPWSRRPDGSVNVRRFGGMKIERTSVCRRQNRLPHAAYPLPDLLQFPQIQRFDEHFVLDLLVDDGRPAARGDEYDGRHPVQIRANAVVLATGGAGRLPLQHQRRHRHRDGDGRHGVLRDMEFVQYHPTGLPGSDPDDRRLPRRRRDSGQQKRLPLSARLRHGPETPLGEPKNKYMELGPRDKVSQPSGTSGGKGTPSRRRAATWSTSISATSARKTAGASAVYL